jgi:serine/threonine protein kinase
VADEIIGGYRLVKLLLTGQSSQIWEVVEISSQLHYAMKLLLPEKVRDPEQRRLLFHEAEVGKQLTHPNLLKTIAVSKDAKNPFLVTEFFPLTSLKQRIVRKKYDFIKEHAPTIFQKAATALAYLHSRGWVHRDVKPDNIVASSGGDVRVIDFALAQRLQKPSFFANLFRRKGPTQGTRSYMSPEQIRGEWLDERADIYSFGASLYEITTYRPPFRAGSNQELLTKHIVEKPVSPQVHNPELTDDFAQLVLHLLAKKREERPRDFHQVLMKLKTVAIYKAASAPKKRSD